MNVSILPASTDSADALALFTALDADLLQRYPGITPRGLHPDDVVTRRLVLFIARVDDRPVGCIALRELEPDAGEVKRMFVMPQFRRQGVAFELLSVAEAEARHRNYKVLRLETATGQPEAIALYESAGYVRIPLFGEYAASPVSVSRCFEKVLG